MEYGVMIENKRSVHIPSIVTEPEAPNNITETIIFIHGIFSEKNEDGRFTRLSEYLSAHDYRTFRFDYCGHGDHSTASQNMTIIDALADVNDVIDYVKKTYTGLYSIVASSFGASLFLLYLQTNKPSVPKRVVLLNPVVDYYSTFIDPACIQMKERFTIEKWEELDDKGFMEFKDLNSFRLSKHFAYELQLLYPFLTFENYNIPTRVIHGNMDTAVSHDITKKFVCVSSDIDFRTIDGADHAFVDEPFEKTSYELTLQWLQEN